MRIFISDDLLPKYKYSKKLRTDDLHKQNPNYICVLEAGDIWNLMDSFKSSKMTFEKKLDNDTGEIYLIACGKEK